MSGLLVHLKVSLALLLGVGGKGSPDMAVSLKQRGKGEARRDQRIVENKAALKVCQELF